MGENCLRSSGNRSRVSALPFSSASRPSAIAHARNARAAPRALASPDISSRRRTTRSRLYDNRGPTYIRSGELGSVVEGAHGNFAHKAKGWLEHKIRHAAELLFVDRNQQERAPLRSGHTSTSLLYHYYSTNITSISSLYHSTVLSAARPTGDRTNRRARQPWKRRHGLGRPSRLMGMALAPWGRGLAFPVAPLPRTLPDSRSKAS